MRASLIAFATAAALAALGCSDDCPECGATGGGGTGAGGAGGGGQGAGGNPYGPCGGPEATACGPNAYCDHEGDPCAPGAKGTCLPRPAQCFAPVKPVCACDGTGYASACEAHQAGVEVAPGATCDPPSDLFKCGDIFCRSNEYCQGYHPGLPDEPVSWSCNPLPESCGAKPTCLCLKTLPCGDMCAPSADGGGLELTCLGV